ncbi:MAG: STAS domain-containing protein [Thermodesulfobacteriota bacterium]|nr:STAS domain-containing protein [Thermodesulfobacteriota bacterium]
MICISEGQSKIRVDFSGNMNRKNILSIRDTILNAVHPEIRKIEFHFDDVRQMDAPAMAMIVIIVKYLQSRKISSRVSGLTGDSKDLATVLGLHHLAEVEGKIKNSISRRRIKERRIQL